MTEYLVDADTLRETRAVVEGMLPSSCAIQTDGAEQTASGAHKPAWTTTATVACALSPWGTGNEALRAGQQQTVQQWQVRLPAGTAVSERNRLVVSGTDMVTGEAWTRTLIVIAVPAPTSIEVLRRVIVRDATAAER